MEHPYRVWYGFPAQVWSCTQRTEVDFIPFKCIKERCVFTKAFVDFGRDLGTHDVIIATPIACKFVKHNSRFDTHTLCCVWSTYVLIIIIGHCSNRPHLFSIITRNASRKIVQPKSAMNHALYIQTIGCNA